MKNIFLLIFIFGFQSLFAQKIESRPVPPMAVNDFGNMLEPFQKQALEQKLRNYNDSTSSAIVIITVPDLQGYDIAEVALKYLRDWGIGVKGKNNGVLILVSKAEHKARIETGYGMEGVLPDILARQIIDERMIPFFKNNDYYYMKCGVIVLDLIPETMVQINLFDKADRTKDKKLAKIMDAVNIEMGKDTLRMAVQRFDRRYRLRAEKLSKKYTTDFKEILKVKN